MNLFWDDERRRWQGTVEVSPTARISVAVLPGVADRDSALTHAEFALSQLISRINEARQYAARRLLGYYNYYNAHLSNGEQLTEESFAARLELEGIRFGGAGQARLYFGHDLYRGEGIYEGGLVLVKVSGAGQFRQASWVTEPDARGFRRHHRGL
jgi:hypothetical protein